MFARNRQKHAEETANKHQRNVQETHLTTSRTIRAKVASFAIVSRSENIRGTRTARDGIPFQLPQTCSSSDRSSAPMRPRPLA